MRFLLLITSLFSTINLLGNTKTSLQDLDSKSYRSYPIKLSRNQIRMIVVPYCDHENAQCLTIATYKMLQDQTFDKIILISQSDSIIFHGVALPCNDNFITDMSMFYYGDFLKQISSHHLFHWYQPPFYKNYNIQKQCLMLEFYTKKTPCISFIVGQISNNDADIIAQKFALYCNNAKTLIVLSADIATYQNCIHNFPCDQSQFCTIYDQDSPKIQAIQSHCLEQKSSMFDASSRSSIFALLFSLLQLPDFKNLESYFVGYAVSDNNNLKNITTHGAFIFQESLLRYKNNIGLYEQRQLLQHARESLCDLFEVAFLKEPCMISYEMTQPHGIFASLYTMTDHGRRLQGCMGKIAPSLSLQEMVYQMTQQATYNDSQCHSFKKNNLYNSIISLDLITDRAQIDHCDAINQHDGIVLEYNNQSALCMPSFNNQPGWNYETTLTDLSYQIGKNYCLWKEPDAKIFTFRSIAFQEE